MFNTSELGSYVWKAFTSSGMYVVISLIVTEIQHHEGSHQHHLQKLKWQVIHLVQQQHHKFTTCVTGDLINSSYVQFYTFSGSQMNVPVL